MQISSTRHVPLWNEMLAQSRLQLPQTNRKPVGIQEFMLQVQYNTYLFTPASNKVYKFPLSTYSSALMTTATRPKTLLPPCRESSIISSSIRVVRYYLDGATRFTCWFNYPDSLMHFLYLPVCPITSKWSLFSTERSRSISPYSNISSVTSWKHLQD